MYGVAKISRLLKIIGLFCKRALFKRLYSAKEIYDFKEPTNRSHPVCMAEYRFTCIMYVCTTDSTDVWMHDITQGGEDA